MNVNNENALTPDPISFKFRSSEVVTLRKYFILSLN